ncbi:MAG: VWA domain-containing protein [Opitutae bacterium]|jgi:Ca-activated chloride channel homolog|nr:VWA domain-containing protein [Opitutae bacterium]MBT5716323.1 VWA domain-containing protein [Opitutae bacterium]
MKKISFLLVAVFFITSGIQILSAKKKKKEPIEPDVHLRVDLDRHVLPAGKKGKAVVKICLEPDEVIREVAKRPPVNLALVLDRSGSMSGEKIAQAKEAAIQAIRRLGTNDLISIVAYSNQAESIASAQKAGNVSKLENLVRNLRANGGTALYAGVNQGAAELRKNLKREYFNRIVLLSDGLANQGPSSTADLVRLGRAFVKEDISVSTIGLGGGYNEDLMTGLAKEGQGNLYFAETSSELSGIFDAEIGDALSVVARNAVIKIEVQGNAKPLRLIGRDGKIKGNQVEIEIKHLYGGQDKFALLEIEVPEGNHEQCLSLANISVSFNSAKGEERQSRKTKIGCTFSDDEKAVNESVNEDVIVAYVDNQVAEAKDQAIQLADEGRHEEAVRQLKKLNFKIESQNRVWDSSSISQKNGQFLDEVEELDQAEGLTNENRKAWKSSNYQVQSQQKIIPKSRN